ncbi:MAG: tetratricopeptide repeat protein [Propionivibrio sp.]|jgi:tetratricopeptide (TPR) repeat protein|uniref:tetratricopeptide repeat protein n=1 Tax=Propionivibrio sp. TaxID=2212460 RepID=UPI001B6340E9|nr:tetratricopeptide repeat protein [Propionivibrio sp.]MBP7201733.1 tetratricopeptide repeat protein [Propionivibrio sp.]MBP8216008.1 tetratricopeptide repeat protein [Propionivibrio sp.]
MKKTPTPERPQPAQMQAIERCVERGEFGEAHTRLARLLSAFPGFKPLRRLAFEIAWQSGDANQAVLAAWEWCEASPNSVPAFEALSDSSNGDYLYFFIHAEQRLTALGKACDVDLDELRTSAGGQALSGEEGIRVDLSRVLMAVGRIEEAGALVASIQHPAAQNNYALTVFAAGRIEQAVGLFESVLQDDPDNFFALCWLTALRLWLDGKAAATAMAGRLLALKTSTRDEARYQMETSILLDQLERAEDLYQQALDASWLRELNEAIPGAADRLHYLGALVAWRQSRFGDAVTRLEKIADEDDAYAEFIQQCLIGRISGETPDWKIGILAQWWPITHIMSLHPEKFARDDELFERWQAPMPHPDYLVATALNGGKGARTLAIAALRYLAANDGDSQAAARDAMLLLLALPCGPDSVRSQLQMSMIEDNLLPQGAPITMFIGGKITEIRPLALTVHNDATEEETVLSPPDFKLYENALDYIAEQKISQARAIMEQLLVRYPDYPRVMTSVATLREAENEPLESWATLVRRAAEIDPGYFFARTGLVKLLVKEGKLEEAREALKPLLEATEMHSSEWRSLILAQIALAKADGDLPALIRLNEMLRDCLERFG